MAVFPGTAGGGAVIAPANLTVPTISGSAVEGATLTASPGTWDRFVDSYAYQWKGDGSNITDATSVTYVLTATEVGKVITVAVTTTNAGGSSSPATSAATGAVSAAGIVGDISDLSVTSNVPTTAVLDFTDATNATSYEERHRTPQTSGVYTDWTSLGEDRIVSGLVESSDYDFQVRGLSASDTGAESNTAQVTTPAGSGLTVNVSFDESWANQPTNLAVATFDVPSGFVSYPDVGFATQQEVDDATALVNKWVSDFKSMISSTGTINLVFGASRYRSVFSGNRLSYGKNNPGNPSTHSEKTVALSTYADYVAVVNAMGATQKALWPLPGSYPLVTNYGYSTTHKAILGSTTDTDRTEIVFNTKQYSWDWDQNINTCAAGKIKAYRTLWHEVTQAIGRHDISGIGVNLMRMIMFAGTAPSSTFWNSQSTAFLSIDGGATSIGATDTISGHDNGDFTAAGGGPFSYESTPIGSTNQLHQPRDYKLIAALYGPSDTCKTLAGL